MNQQPKPPLDSGKSWVTPGWIRAVCQAPSQTYGRLVELHQVVRPTRPLRVVEIGCQNGWLGRYCETRANRDGWPLEWLGVDNDACLIATARQRCAKDSNLRFAWTNDWMDCLPAAADAALLSWASHKMSRGDLTQTLARLHRMQPAWLCVRDWESVPSRRWLLWLLLKSGAAPPEIYARPWLTGALAAECILDAGFHVLRKYRSWPSQFGIEATYALTCPLEETGVPVWNPTPALASTSLAALPRFEPIRVPTA